MRKSGWAAATGLGSLVLLLAACGGSSGSNAAAGSTSSGAQASSGSSGPAGSATAASTATSTGGSTPTASAKPHKSVAPQPSSGDQSIPAAGTTVMIVQKSAIGYVLAEANHQVVYTYSKDKKNGPPTCVGSCAAIWPPATGTPQAGPASHFPGAFAVIKGAGGVQQITYNGYPLYTLKGAKPLSTSGNGQGGLWHVVPLSASDISA
jgi:predicted lipoprotein with Yx(FWY)xxD motif